MLHADVRRKEWRAPGGVRHPASGPSRHPLALLAVSLVALAAGSVQAQTAGPIEPDQPPHLTGFGGSFQGSAFPQWYSDRNGVGLELCTAKNDVANACVYDSPIGPDGTPVNAYAETLGMGGEAFWWLAETSMPFAGGQAQIVMAVEAAFFTSETPLEGDEWSFGRLRLRIDVPEAGTYKVTHPFGEEILVAETAGTKAINTTIDIGAARPDWSGPLKSRVGAFLVWSGAPAAPAGYVGDGVTPHRVTGSPYGTNVFKVEKIDNPAISATTDQFVVSGKLWSGQLDAPLEKRRVTYDGYRLEVLAASAPTATVTATYNGITNSLVSDGKGYFYISTPVPQKPGSVVIKATNPNNTPTSITSVVVDNVRIIDAQYNPNTSELTVAAKSSMYDPSRADANLKLTLEPFNVTVPQSSTSITAVVKDLKVPPARVKVKSSYGGSEIRSVEILDASPAGPSAPGTTPPPTPTASAPAALADSGATVINTAFVIDVLANDTDPDGLDPNSIAITAPPPATAGTATPAGLAGIQVVPAKDYQGQFTFAYTVKDKTGAVSAPASVTVTVTRETVTVTQAEFRTSQGWRIRGTSDARTNNTVTAYLNGTAVIGSAAVDPAGDWDIRVNTTTAPSGTLTIKTSKGTTFPATGGINYTTRR